MISTGLPRRTDAEVLPDPVRDDDGVVQRIADDGENRREFRQVEGPAEHGEGAERHDDIVGQGRHRANGELARKAEHDVDHHHRQRHEHGDAPLLRQFFADRRTHHFGATQRDVTVRTSEQHQDFVAHRGLIDAGLGRDADQDIRLRPEVLYHRLLETRVLELLAHLLRHHRDIETDLDQRATGEVKSAIEAEGDQGHDRHDEQAPGQARGRTSARP